MQTFVGLVRITTDAFAVTRVTPAGIITFVVAYNEDFSSYLLC